MSLRQKSSQSNNNKRKTVSRLLSIAPTLLVAACATSPRRSRPINQGSWEARVLIKDKKHFKSTIVDADFAAENNKRLRVDINSTIGTPLAMLVLNGDHASYLLIHQKRFYEGKSRKGILRPILEIPLDPRLVYNILFDQPIQRQGWSCSVGGNGFAKECHEKSTGLHVRWLHSQSPHPRVVIDHRLAQLQIAFKKFSAQLPYSKSLFALKVPPDFKRYYVH